jgi:hypothetical protein
MQRFIRISTIAVVVGVFVLLLSLWWDGRDAVSLPVPKGPFAVGRTIDVWNDDGATRIPALQAGTVQELLVWIWYPAAPANRSEAPREYFARIPRFRTWIESSVAPLDAPT